MSIALEDILKRIELADDLEINEIMSAVRNRFASAFPEWEIVYVSCPKNDPIQRQQAIDFILKHFQSKEK